MSAEAVTTDRAGAATADGRMVSFRRHVAALGLFVLLTALMLYPYPRRAATYLRDLGDPLEYAWVLGYSAHRLLEDPLRLYEANIFYPFGNALAYSDSTIASTITVLPVILATDNPVLASNALILLSFVLAGFGAYLLVADLTGSRLAGVVAGVVFAFNPFRIDHLSQVPNAASHWMPFVFLALSRYLSRRSSLWAVGFGVFLSLQLLSSFYYAYAISLAVAVYLLCFLIWQPRRLLQPRMALPLLAALAAAGMLLVATSLPYFEVSRRYGMQRTVEAAEYFAARPQNYLGVPAFNRTWGRVQLLASQAAPERMLFPGALALLLAGFGLAKGQPRGQAALFAVVGLFAFALSLGPSLHLGATGPPVALPFPMPYRVLFEHLPGFQSMRVPARFAVVVMLAVAVLAGLGAARLLRWVERALNPVFSHCTTRSATERVQATGLPLPQGKVRGEDSAPIPLPGRAREGLGVRASILTAALVGVALAEYASFPIPMEPVQTGAAIPEVYRWLRDQPAKGVLVELPIDDDAYHQTPYMYFSTYHGWTLVNGARAFEPPGYAELASVLQAFPSHESIAVLANLGVRYVVVHANRLPEGDLARRQARLQGYAGQARLVQQFGDDHVYEVVAPAAPPALRLSVVSSCQAEVGRPYPVDLVLDAPGGQLIALTDSLQRLVVSAEWTSRDGGRFAQELSVAPPDRLVRSGQAVHLDLAPPPDPGTYSLKLDVEPPLAPGAAGPAPRAVAVVPRASRPAATDGAPILQATSFDLPRKAVMATDAIPLRITWKAHGSGQPRGVAFVNVYDSKFRVWTMWSGPVSAGPFAGQAWCDGDEVLDVREARLFRDTPPGYYWVEFGVMDPMTGRREPILDPTGKPVDKLTAGPLRVSRAPVYRVEDVLPQRQVWARLGDRVELLGWAAAPEVLRSGQTLRLWLYWLASRPPDADYTTFVHLYDSAGRLVAQRDGPPGDGAWPTSLWQPGDVVEDVVELQVPSGLPPGEYTLAAGMYDLSTMRRLPLVEGPGLGDDRVLLGKLTVGGE